MKDYVHIKSFKRVAFIPRRPIIELSSQLRNVFGVDVLALFSVLRLSAGEWIKWKRSGTRRNLLPWSVAGVRYSPAPFHRQKPVCSRRSGWCNNACDSLGRSCYVIAPADTVNYPSASRDYSSSAVSRQFPPSSPPWLDSSSHQHF